MKREVKIIITAVLIICICGVAARAAENKYVFGFATGLDPSQNAQLKTSFADVLKVLSAKEKMEFSAVYYNDSVKFEQALKKGEVDFFLTDTYSILYRAVRQYGYQPFMGYSMYGQKMCKYCIYVKNESPYASAADLKGKKLVTYKYDDVIFMLRGIIGGEPPDKYFRIKTVKDGNASVYSLSLDQTESIFVNNYGFEYAKLTNPGSVKMLRELVCAPPVLMVPISHRKGIPPEVIDAVEKMLENAKKDEELKKYKPLIKMVKLSYFPVTEKDVAPMFSLIENALKRGWGKDFDKWAAQDKSEGERE